MANGTSASYQIFAINDKILRMNYFTIIQTVLALLLVGSILLQGRGAGIGSTWGGDGETYGTRRGIEKLLFKVTIILAFCFILVSGASLVI